MNVLMIISLQCYSQTLFSSSMEWANGRYNGEVTIRSFKKVPHGSGTYEDYNGNKYVGLWSEGKKNGKGVYYHACGDKVAGTWIKGKLQGKAKYYFADGSIYDIIYKNGKSVRKTKISSGKSVARNRKSSQQQGKVKNNTTSRPSASSSTTSTKSGSSQPLIMITRCEACHGVGMIQSGFMGPWATCMTCGGRGEIKKNISVPQGAHNSEGYKGGYNGGSNSGTTNRKVRNLEQEKRDVLNRTVGKDCPACGGNGKCHACKGTKVAHSFGNTYKCEVCSDGRCGVCEGSGKTPWNR